MRKRFAIAIILAIILVSIATTLFFSERNVIQEVPASKNQQAQPNEKKEVCIYDDDFRDCRAMQLGSERDCDKTYEDYSVDDSAKKYEEILKCKFRMRMKSAIEEGDKEMCGQITAMEGYSGLGETSAFFCLLSTIGGKGECSEIGKIIEKDKEELLEFCSLFFDISAQENFENDDKYSKLDIEEKNIIRYIKAIRERNSTLCSGFLKRNDGTKTGFEWKCLLMTGAQKTKENSFCEEKAATCYYNYG